MYYKIQLRIRINWTSVKTVSKLKKINKKGSLVEIRTQLFSCFVKLIIIAWLRNLINLNQENN